MKAFDGKTESAIERFDRQARAYRDCMAEALHAPGRRIVSELEAIEPRVVLDVGTGVGTLLPHIQSTFPGARVLGCDGSRGMLALVPVGTTVAAMDAQRLAVASDSVDVVLTVFMLLFLEEPVVALREARRVLRPGGSLGAVTWGTEFESPALSIWTECLNEQAAPEAATARPYDELVNTPDKMHALLNEAGFESVRTWHEELELPIDLEGLVRMKTSIGREKARFDLLDADSQERFLARARERLRELDPENFVARARVVYARSEAT